MRINSKIADMLLILTAVIWGTGFIATEFAIDTGAKTSLIISMRFLMAGAILFLVCFKDVIKTPKRTMRVGVTAGIILFFGFYIQTLGQAYTTVSNSSFLTGTSVIMVPFIVWIFTKKKPRNKIFALAFLSMIGITLLTMDFSAGGFSFKTGDIAVLISAFCFAGHITYLGVFGRGHNVKQMTFLQMTTAGVVALLFMLIFDSGAIDFEIIRLAFIPTLYLAVFSGCICYFLQTTAQQHTTPAKAGIILSTEGLFGSIFSVMLGIDALSFNLIIGGFVIMLAVILSEVDFKPKRKTQCTD